MSLSQATYMEKEAAQASEAVAALLDANRDVLGELGRQLKAEPPALVVTCARGSSDHAATYGKYLLETKIGVPVASAAPSVSSIYQAPVGARNALLVAISQSGSSPDLLAVVEAYRRAGSKVASIVNVEDSPLASLGDWFLPLKAGAERSVAATKTYIASLAMQAALAAAWSGDAALTEALEHLPEALAAVARHLRFDFSDLFSGGGESLFVLGRGLGFGVAQEAALKFKETCALHAEAFSAAEVRHGPMAIVGEAFPVIAFATSDAAGDTVRDVAGEFAARGARVGWIDALEPLPQACGAENLAALARHPALEPILMIQAFYFLVNGLSLARDLNPDEPRFLSKVTRTQ